MSADIAGDVAPGFEAVADAFRGSFDSDTMGAALCVYLARPCRWSTCGVGIADARTQGLERQTPSASFSRARRG